MILTKLHLSSVEWPSRYLLFLLCFNLNLLNIKITLILRVKTFWLLITFLWYPLFLNTSCQSKSASIENPNSSNISSSIQPCSTIRLYSNQKLSTILVIIFCYVVFYMLTESCAMQDIYKFCCQGAHIQQINEQYLFEMLLLL